MAEHESDAAAERGYERSSIDSRRIALSLAALAGTLIVIAIATFWLMRGLAVDQALPLVVPDSSELHLPPAPRLQAAPARDLAEYRRQQARRLHGYRWIDASQGVVQIPIGRAMAIEIERARQGDRATP